jgi:allantoinase
MSRRFAIASSRVVTPSGVRPAAVLVVDGRIEAVLNREDAPSDAVCEDFGDLAVSPGLVDAHVHVNEPGRTDWEGFATATEAAAAGGVTTLVDMPLNSSPVTTRLAALEEKQAAACDQCRVDVGFYAGLVPGNLADLEPLLDAGVCGVKAFLCDSGLPEFPASGEAELRAAAPLLARRGVSLLAHAELVDPAWPRQEIRSFHDWAWSRPPSFELNAIALLTAVCREFRMPTHIVHLSTAQPLEEIVAAKNAGLPLTVETCPHYLHFKAEDLRFADPRWKCAPPIRTGETRKQLWDALLSGAIDTIGSDHSPCPVGMKHLDDGDWSRAWGGISSLELTLPIVWTQRPKATPLVRLAQWLSSRPAKLTGLDGRKGSIAPGYDADFCVWDVGRRWTVEQKKLHCRHKISAYDGAQLQGQVVRTYVRGQLVFEEGKFPAAPSGRLLRRDARSVPC